jgi:DNA primase
MAGLIPDKTLEEIRERADIVDVLSDHLTLTKAGRNYKGLCPFHNEKTPSFMVSPEKQLFHCFGCGAGGNVFTFLMKYEQISFAEAARSLAQRYGVRIPEVQTTSRDQRREELLRVNAAAQEFFLRQLREEAGGGAARSYLTHRGITRPLWEEYGIGYAPARWDGLTGYFKTKGIAVKGAETLGLIIPKKGGWYDRFRGRIIFPVNDLQGRIIGFGGRVLGSDEEPKYLNSPDSLLYKKGASFYGLNVARSHIQREGGKVCIVEGYFDLLSMAQHGIKNVVAALGTALTPEQVGLARRFGKDFFLLFDPDEAGVKAAMRGLELFIREDAFPTVIPLPDGLDPDGYFQKKGGSPQALWSRAVPGVEYAMDILLKGYDLTAVEGQARGVDAVLPFLLQIKDGVRRDLYLQRLAEKTRVKEEEVRAAAFAVRTKHARTGAQPTSPTALKLSPEKKLVQMMMQYPEVIPLVIEAGALERFEDRMLRSIAEAVIQDVQRHGGFSLERLTPLLEAQGASDTAIAMAFQEEELPEGIAPRVVEDCLRQIKMKALRRQIAGLKRKIKEAEAQGDEALLHSLFLSMKALGPQLNKLQREGLKGTS